MIRTVVVDDHDSVRTILVALLTEYGLDVVASCANGREAAAVCRDLRPAAVVMDIRMPVLDGIAATREIKDFHPETRVILLTAYEEDDLRNAGLAAGADEVVVKGISGHELADLVRSVGSCEAA
jgi:DNA-binding NarL/FixJ family response regulator